MRQGNKANCRKVFERSLTELSPENVEEDLWERAKPLTRRYLEFAKFEIRCQEYERARAIFRYGLKQTKQHDTL